MADLDDIPERILIMADTDSPAPNWSNNIPLCSEACPHHDGKRCRLMGMPDSICEPEVRRTVLRKIQLHEENQQLKGELARVLKLVPRDPA